MAAIVRRKNDQYNLAELFINHVNQKEKDSNWCSVNVQNLEEARAKYIEAAITKYIKDKIKDKIAKIAKIEKDKIEIRNEELPEEILVEWSEDNANLVHPFKKMLTVGIKDGEVDLIPSQLISKVNSTSNDFKLEEKIFVKYNGDRTDLVRPFARVLALAVRNGEVNLIKNQLIPKAKVNSASNDFELDEWDMRYITKISQAQYQTIGDEHKIQYGLIKLISQELNISIEEKPDPGILDTVKRDIQVNFYYSLRRLVMVMVPRSFEPLCSSNNREPERFTKI